MTRRRQSHTQERSAQSSLVDKVRSISPGRLRTAPTGMGRLIEQARKEARVDHVSHFAGWVAAADADSQREDAQSDLPLQSPSETDVSAAPISQENHEQ